MFTEELPQHLCHWEGQVPLSSEGQSPREGGRLWLCCHPPHTHTHTPALTAEGGDKAGPHTSQAAPPWLPSEDLIVLLVENIIYWVDCFTYTTNTCSLKRISSTRG